MRYSNAFFAAILLFALCACSDQGDDAPLPDSHAARAEIMVIADGWTPAVSFEIPQPGTYTLSKIAPAGGGSVLSVDGEEMELSDLFGDNIVLLTFMYTSCTDLNGCPLATAVFYKVKEHFKAYPELASHIRLISISFNPEHDTPKVMKSYSSGFEQGHPQWLFLTTASEAVLQPIIDQYGQMVIKEYDQQGEYMGSMAHVLRAFLIDRTNTIRQQYSVSFLHDQLISADIKTLLIEGGILTADTDH